MRIVVKKCPSISSRLNGIILAHIPTSGLTKKEVFIQIGIVNKSIKIMTDQKKIPPTILFIFGGSGDLTSRKLIPALYNLYLDNYMPEKFIIIGVGRTSFSSDDEYRNKLLEGVQQFSRRKDELNTRWPGFAANLFYHELDLMADTTYDGITTW